MPGPWTLESFVPHVQSTFDVSSDSGNVGLTLVEAVSVAEDDPRVEQFSLLFQGDPGVVLPSAQHTLRHDELGDLEIFISRVINPDTTQAYYQACFSRMRRASDDADPTG